MISLERFACPQYSSTSGLVVSIKLVGGIFTVRLYVAGVTHQVVALSELCVLLIQVVSAQTCDSTERQYIFS